MSLSLGLNAGSGEKRKKVSKQEREGPWHQSHSIAISTTVTDDDDRPLARQCTTYTPTIVPTTARVSEDTDTLLCAARLDGFSYLLGNDIQQETNDLNNAGNIIVEVRNLPKRYDSTVRV